MLVIFEGPDLVSGNTTGFKNELDSNPAMRERNCDGDTVWLFCCKGSESLPPNDGLRNVPAAPGTESGSSITRAEEVTCRKWANSEGAVMSGELCNSASANIGVSQSWSEKSKGNAKGAGSATPEPGTEPVLNGLPDPEVEPDAGVLAPPTPVAEGAAFSWMSKGCNFLGVEAFGCEGVRSPPDNPGAEVGWCFGEWMACTPPLPVLDVFAADVVGDVLADAEDEEACWLEECDEAIASAWRFCANWAGRVSQFGGRGIRPISSITNATSSQPIVASSRRNFPFGARLFSNARASVRIYREVAERLSNDD